MADGDDEPARGTPDSRAAARARIDQQATWVELSLQRAVERGEFEDLPGFGKPIDGLGAQHDPDWWVKRLIERERISGVLPPALQLRTDDAELDDRLDRLTLESEVRRELEDFNERVRAAFYQPLGGPPMVTRERDVEAEVGRWRERRTTRHASPTSEQDSPRPGGARPRRRPGLLRRIIGRG